MEEQRKLSMIGHLEELRFCIIRVLLLIAIVTGICLFFVEDIMHFMINPVGQVIFLAPQDALIARIKFAFYAGIFFSFPLAVFLFWKFMSEAFTISERKIMLFFLPTSVMLFYGGVLFGAGVVLPISLQFLMDFSSALLRPAITIDKYLAFACGLSLAFGFVFELPLMMVFLTKLKIITPQYLSSARRYVIVLIFIISAVLTPPDVISQCLMALPLYLLYELGILLSRVIYQLKP